MSEYAHPESLASTQWVSEHLDDPNVRIVEVVWGADPSFGLPAYLGGHIPGAIVWEFDNSLQDKARGDILNQGQLDALLSKSGIGNDSTVVLYSGLSNQLATYAFWQLKVGGHQDVRLLDGDRQRWLDENRPLSGEAPEVTATTYRASEPNLALRAEWPEVLRSIGQEDVLLVDARSPEMYRGEFNPRAARGGHIPGAINLAARRETREDGSFVAWRLPSVGPEGTFKPADELRRLFESHGITPEANIITYCLGGGLSTHTWFALTQLLGYPNVREYDRSWAEWGNLPDVPIEV